MSYRFEFDSYDFHSGLREIHWRLHDSLDPDALHGSGQIAVHRHNVCITAHISHDNDGDVVPTMFS